MQTIRKIQDLELLVFACRRANKVREEGRAHFSLGVLRDNIGHYMKGIECYNKFLKVCEECRDGQGAALAYHCIAVNYQLLGGGAHGTQQGGDGRGATSGAGLGSSAASGSIPEEVAELKPDLLRKSITYHNKHRETSDSIGKFVAHLNMGLVYASLGERDSSTVNHQYALRYALQLRSIEGQSLALGNLSFTAGTYENDPAKMRSLVERYLELCGMLRQQRNQAAAYKRLGILADQQGEKDQCISYFKHAIVCAREQGDSDVEKDCSVRLGIAAGQARMADHFNQILERTVLGPSARDGSVTERLVAKAGGEQAAG